MRGREEKQEEVINEKKRIRKEKMEEEGEVKME